MSSHIVEYCVLKDYSLDKLEESVNEKLKKGWTVWGSLCVVFTSHEPLHAFNYFQPIVKIKEDEKK